MKQIIFISLIICGYTSFAQFQNGTTLADLNVNVYGTTYDGYYTVIQPDGSLGPLKYSQNNFQGNYTLAYNRFFNSSVLWGARVGYNHSKSEHTIVSTSLSKRHGVSIGPYMKKYFNLIDKLYFTLDLAPVVAFHQDNNDNGTDQSTSRTITYRLSLSPGLTYLLTERWWMSAGFGNFYYSLSHTKDVPDQGNPTIKEQNYGLYMNANSFSIGLQYVFIH